MWLLLMSGSVIDFKDLLVYSWDEGGFCDFFGAGITDDRITRRLTSLVIAACDLFPLWVEINMFREEEGGDRLRGVVDLMRSMMISMIKGEIGEGGFELRTLMWARVDWMLWERGGRLFH